MSKSNKELVAELTSSFITSWNSKEGTRPISNNDISSVFNTFKNLIESMDEKDEE